MEKKTERNDAVNRIENLVMIEIKKVSVAILFKINQPNYFKYDVRKNLNRSFVT
jgi:hypothetical protein